MFWSSVSSISPVFRDWSCSVTFGVSACACVFSMGRLILRTFFLESNLAEPSFGSTEYLMSSSRNYLVGTSRTKRFSLISRLMSASLALVKVLI